MPLFGSLQRGITQLSIIHTCFMLIQFTPSGNLSVTHQLLSGLIRFLLKLL